MSLSNKTAIITGASRGIGKAIALELARQGANVAILYAGNAEAAEQVCIEARTHGVKAQSYACNVADFSQSKEVCDKILTDFGGIDILINNAGITKDSLLLRMDEDSFDQVIDVNLKGAFNFIKHTSRMLMKSSCGRIVNVSSVSGLMGNVGQANYSAAKSGLIGLTKTVAKELAGRNVTCNAIAPGFIETDMTANLPNAVHEYIDTSVPLKRMGKAEEVAALVAFLVSDAAAYITGEVIRVDGGMCM
ncbi:MAG: 3-oxoacyl-[acyl-carrier-protein] reductase [Oscillospiraceae bacterium]|nr:3-oxoacyl-[acyl-carrier-protein] reductase [Oscillospiraceae bacterium]